MKTSWKKLPGSIIEIETTLTPAEFNDYWQPVYDAAIKSVTIPGFRQGSAPESMAAGAVNRERVLEEAAREAAIEALEKTRSEHDWTLVSQPEVEVLEASVKPGVSVALRLRGRLTILPEVKLGDYRALAKRIIANDRREVKVSDEDIDRSIMWLRRSRAKVALVDRPAILGDLIEADIASTMDGKPVAGGQLQRDKFTLGESRFMPGFDAALVGKRAGETVRFDLTAPPDYWHEALRNKVVSFVVTMRGVFSQDVPEFTDEFAKLLGPSFTGVASVRESIVSGLTAERESHERDRVRARIIEEIVKQAEVDVPEIMIQATLDGLAAEITSLNPKAPEVLDQSALREQLKDRARQRTIANLVLYQIAKNEKLEPTPEEVEAESRAAGIDPAKGYDYSYAVVRNKKVFALLDTTP